MKKFMPYTGLLLALFWGWNACAEQDPRPNIILIMADDMGYECVGANGGSPYQTPALDQLAKTGVRFEHCYSQPLCTPSRVQIMTGIYNVRNYVRFGVLDRSQTTFAHILKKAGYATCIAGKWQLGRQADAPQHFGFDESCLWQHTRGARDEKNRDTRYPNPHLEINGEPADYSNGEYGPDVVSDFLCDFMERNQDNPFLAYYPMILPHSPFVPTPDSKNPNSRNNQQNFVDMVEHIDKIVGKLTAKLDELEIRENTLLLFTTDNGTAGAIRSELNGREVSGGKGEMTDAGTHVPLIASWPGTITGERVLDDLVDFSDILPTLCDAAGVAVPPELNVDGRSFLPQLKGQAGNPREWIYCWYSRGGGRKGEEWARNRQYKLYRTGEFYDVSQDVLEQTPLKELSPDAREVRDMLQEALDPYRDARPANLAALVSRNTNREEKKAAELVPAKEEARTAKRSPRKARSRKEGKKKATGPAPTHANVSYDDHERTQLDFWQAEGEGPRPVRVFIHGGGWIQGDKKQLRDADTWLAKGISVAAVNYRLSETDPLPAPVHDAVRAIQFLRHKAGEWNIDKNKFVLTGGSAGGCSSLIIACHDDFADPDSEDPVERESSRVQGAAVAGAQSSIDPRQIEPWIGTNVYHAMIYKAVGEESIEDALENYAKHEATYEEFSAYNHLSKDDPPLYLGYNANLTLPATSLGHGIHHGMFGVKLKERSEEVGHKQVHLDIRGKHQSTEYSSQDAFIDGILLGE